MVFQGRAPGLLGLAVAGLAALAVASCGPANDRPRSGAAPGSGASTPAGIPPTLTPSDGLPVHVAAAPSPVVEPSPSPLASASAVAAPPIVRTIVPGAHGRVPAGAPVTLSAILVGRGADLASASLSLNGADAGAQIDKRTPREWSIHTNPTLGAGSYTVRVSVRDASGVAGGFTWQFLVGNEGNDPSTAAVQASPAPKPPSP
ncbi:MAG: hypothetical protein M3069_07165 [Chloroflexota bacterium]|nr:hypothetical protein [Chloroflexota bacterium]